MATESQIRFSIKSVITIVTIITLLAINLTERDPRSPEQIHFEDWLSKTQSEFEQAEQLLSKAGESLVPLPTLSDIELTISSPDLPNLKYLLSARAPRSEISALSQNNIEESEESGKLFRVLSILKEAGLFNRKPFNIGSNDRILEVNIDSGSEHFKTRFSSSSIDTNPQAQLFLKLAQIYAQPQEATALANNQAQIQNQENHETR